MAEAEADGAGEAPGALSDERGDAAGAAHGATAADRPKPAALLAAPVARPGWRPSTASVGAPVAPACFIRGFQLEY
jgi:hypothetical protein